MDASHRPPRDQVGRPDIVFELDEISAGPDDSPQWTVRARRWVSPLLLLLLAGVVIGIYRVSIEPSSDDGPPVIPFFAAPARTASPPGLIAPATARPGEQITVVGYRDRDLCGPTELRFDGYPVVHQIQATARPRSPDSLDVLMVMEVPAAAGPGTHHIQLWGPVRGGDYGVCGDIPVHQAQLDTIDIEISSP
jgi:hypothetical protein